MQPNGGLIQHIEGLASRDARELLGELYALRFTTRKRRGRLPQADITTANILQCLQLAADARERFKVLQRAVHGHVQDVRDAFVLETHLQRFVVIPAASADLAWNVNIRQELHFNPELAFPTAGFTATTLDVERKTPFIVSAQFRVWQAGEQIADHVEHARIGSGVRSRCASNRRLVDIDDLVEMFDALDTFMLAGISVRAHQLACQCVIENVDRQG